jgi:hypothetical protein
VLDRTTFTARLRKSLKLQDPSIETDEAYKFTDNELWDIAEQSTFEHNGLYTLTTLPDNEVFFVLMLCKKELYYQLATSTAPFYPIKAEGAELRKDVRFDHYMQLIKTVSEEYYSKWELFSSNTSVVAGNTIISSRHHTPRNTGLYSSNNPNLVIDNFTSTEVCISWDKFNNLGGLFGSYAIYLSTSPIFDVYENTITNNSTLVELITNIHRTCMRISNLESTTQYYILVMSQDINGLSGYSEQHFTTLP